MKKINLDVLENADDDILKQLSEEEKLTKSEKDRMFEKSLKYYYHDISVKSINKEKYIQAEVKNESKKWRNATAASAAVIVMLSALLIGILLNKDGAEITDHRKNENIDPEISNTSSETEKKNYEIYSECVTTFVSDKASNVNTTVIPDETITDKKDKDTSVKEKILTSVKEKIDVLDKDAISTPVKKISESIKNTLHDENAKSEIRERMKELYTQQTSAPQTSTPQNTGKQKTENNSETVNIDRIKEVLYSQNYVTSNEGIKSDFMYYSDNILYGISFDGTLLRYIQASDGNETVEKAVMSDEDRSYMNALYQKYGVSKFALADCKYFEYLLKNLSYGNENVFGKPEYLYKVNDRLQYEIDVANKYVWRICIDSNGKKTIDAAQFSDEAYLECNKCISGFGPNKFYIIKN